MTEVGCRENWEYWFNNGLRYLLYRKKGTKDENKGRRWRQFDAGLQVILLGWKRTTTWCVWPDDLIPSEVQKRCCAISLLQKTWKTCYNYCPHGWMDGLRFFLVLSFVPSSVFVGGSVGGSQMRGGSNTSLPVFTRCVTSALVKQCGEWWPDEALRSLYLFLLLRSHKNLTYPGYLVVGCSSHGPPVSNSPC